MDLLMKKLEAPAHETAQAMDARMTCEVCGNSGHSGNNCPETREHTCYIKNNGSNNNNRFHPNNCNNQGWNSKPNLTFDRPQGGKNFNNNGNNFSNQPSIKDLVLGQVPFYHEKSIEL
jgi:hypothetical protein